MNIIVKIAIDNKIYSEKFTSRSEAFMYRTYMQSQFPRARIEVEIIDGPEEKPLT